VDILERIFARKREDLAAIKARLPLKEIQSRLAEAPKPRGFLGSLVESKHPVSLIAEVKKASPVKGVIREDFDPKEIANSYRAAGADCLSVLTDVEFFQGDPSYLAICREESGLPVLRKDFTVDEYDVWFSRMLGADAVLLIVSGLDKHQLRDYRQLAESLEMDALVEAHSEAEAETALESGAKLVGINNRDLATFETNLETSERIIPMVAKHATVVSESALRNHEDIVRSAAAGARAVLIGTTFCAAPNIEEKVKEVMGW
jgi:indole-3-glycerol phosphate synthase